MTEESGKSDAYAAVLADLKTKRAQIDTAIRAIEALQVSGSAAVVGEVVGTDEAPNQNLANLGAGAFLGMTIVEATKKLLRSRKQSLNNAYIVAALKAGGMAMDSADPINTVGSVLTRRFNKEGDIVRVGRGTWGLKEWYPNRSFGKKEAAKAEITDSSEPEQPSSPPRADFLE